MSDPDDELNRQGKMLNSLPLKEQGWSNIKILNLSNNNIKEINGKDLPVGLEYLDLSENPLRTIHAPLPSTLSSLILKNTDIGKLPVLPETLADLVIQGSPISKKYDMETQTGISDKITIQRISGKPFEKYETMLEKTPPPVIIPVNNTSVNESNSEINSWEKATSLGSIMKVSLVYRLVKPTLPLRS